MYKVKVIRGKRREKNENYKAIWDLYVNNAVCDKTTLASVTGDMSEAEFGTGKAVFYQNGTWEYANLTGEEKSALACGIENCWAVNSKASYDGRTVWSYSVSECKRIGKCILWSSQ